MEDCILCKDEIANQTGSHIIPHFILKRIENLKDKSGRGYEIGFVIHPLFTTSHFGQSILPEKLEEIYGKLTEKEINENTSPYIYDNIFCQRCEKRLATIENLYAKTIITTSTKQYKSGVSQEMGLLFWSSVLWRISFSNITGFQLTKNNQEILRRILNRSLKINPKKINVTEMQAAKDIIKISYKILRCINYSDKNPTFIFFHPNFRNPYLLFIDEFIILFSFNNNYNDIELKDPFEIQKELISTTKNSSNLNEKIFPLSSKVFGNSVQILNKKLAENRISELNRFWDGLHVRIGGKGKTMPKKLKAKLFESIVSKEKKLGRICTLDDLVKTTLEVVNKYNNNP